LKKSLIFWIEGYFYTPDIFQKIISIFFLPLSYLYCFIVYLKYRLVRVKDLDINIVSIGNLNVGGSGKTPLTTALASNYDKSAVVLRGYGRDSKGLYIIKDFNNILCGVEISGDEAMIYAQKLKDSIVIVSENRILGIEKAKELGAKIVFLDDGYSKHFIKKLDFLIDIKTKNTRCLPSGSFREKLWSGKKAYFLEDGKDFKRVVTLKNKSDKMSLVTAIARPQRLDEFLPNVVSKNYFEDHHSFTKEELESILKKDGSDSILVTYKDFVKIESFGLPLSLLDLDIEVNEKIFKIIGNYIAKKN